MENFLTPRAREPWILAALCFLLVTGPVSCDRAETPVLERIRESGVLRVGTDATYPPFESVDPTSGQVVGFDIDLMRALAAKLGAKPDFVVVNFDGIIAGLKTRKYDAVISAMTITPERALEVGFSRPYAAAGQSIAMRGDAPAIASTSELQGMRIGVQLATTGEMEAKKIAGADVRSFDAIGAAFRDLENGNLDAVIADTPTARIFIREHPDIKLVGSPLTHEEYGIAVRTEDSLLREAFNAALDDLRRDGLLAEMELRWGFVEGN